MTQKQKGGDNSLNVQGRDVVIHMGITAADAKVIANEVWQSNFVKMKGDALQEVNERMDWFVQEFINRLSENSPEIMESLKEPDVIYSLLQAETEYARSGEEALGETLIDLLTERCRANERSLNSIVLNEAIKTVGGLTIGQINALTAWWLVMRVNVQPMQSQSQLFAWIQSTLVPLVELLPKKHAAYEHLSYTGCAQISIGTHDLGGAFWNSYPGLFSKGFLLDEVPSELQAYSGLFMTCLNDPEKIQVAAITQEQLKELASMLEIPTKVDAVTSLQNSQHMGPGEIIEMISQSVPGFRAFAEVWKSTPLENLVVSTVGIAIAHSHWRRRAKGCADLSIWIPEED